MFPRLFSPISLAGVEVKNRIVMCPMSNHMAGRMGELEEREIAFYVERAKGGAGLIVVGAAFVHPSGRFAGELGIDRDEVIPGFRKLTNEIHRYGAKVSIQLHHAGRQTKSAICGCQPVAPSPIPWPPGGEVPRELTVDEIHHIVEWYGKAAARAKEAGFDMVEIHCAHGYLPAQFLSPAANRREDEYGGDLVGRTRFIREVLQAVRDAVGSGFPISVRISGSEFTEGGLTLEDQKVVAGLLEELGVTFISVSAGMAPYYRTVPNMVFEPGVHVFLAAAIKEVVRVPVMATGRINDPLLAERILEERGADLIGMGRPLICDPQLPNKAVRGRVDEIRKCIACNKGCHDPSRADRTTHCLLNPEAGRETELVLTPVGRPKAVMIVGGGPAGMEAARVLTLRGHRVTIYERSSTLGGRLRLAVIPPQKREYAHAVEYLAREVARLGIPTKLSTEVTIDIVRREAPDVVLLATGARAVRPAIPGVEADHVVTADDILSGRVAPGDQVVVIGGGSVGAETAHYLAAQGKRVILIEMLSDIALDMPPDARHHLLSALRALGVQVRTGCKAKEILHRVIKVETETGLESIADVDTVVLAVGVAPNRELAELLCTVVPDVRVVGDAASPGDALKAILEGAVVAREI